ncbi:hypothetical protein HN670_03075 [bacterium]|jgi:hypothetical protein|nr:hypothetical protein [bacterium]
MTVAVLEQQNKRQLNSLKQGALDRKKQEAFDQVKKKVIKASKRAVLRSINSAFAATLVGLIVTYFIMGFQFFVGNLLGRDEVALSGLEAALWLSLNFALFVALIIFLALGYSLAHPAQSFFAFISGGFSL